VIERANVAADLPELRIDEVPWQRRAVAADLSEMLIVDALRPPATIRAFLTQLRETAQVKSATFAREIRPRWPCWAPSPLLQA
jgi:hypothetical protein